MARIRRTRPLPKAYAIIGEGISVYLTFRDKLNRAIQNGHKFLKNIEEDPQCSHTRIFEVFDQLLMIN